MFLKFIIIGLVLSVGNFTWQAFTGHNWEQAFERSYFQIVACLICAIAIKF
jgi:hypothetical protein